MPPENTKQDPPLQRPTAIHTMKSDAEELLKTQQPSLIKIAARERRPPEVYGERPRRFSRAVPYVIIGVVLIGMGAGAFFVLRQGVGPLPFRRGGAPGPAAGEPLRIAPPPPYFATESSRTITVKKTDRAQFARLMADTWREKERVGTMKQIVVKVQDGPAQRFATVADFFDLWRMEPPPELTELAAGDLMIFMYTSNTGNRLGIAARVAQPERAFAAMLGWEPSVLAAALPLFFDERVVATFAPFEDRSWRNISWRYLKATQGQGDIGIGHFIFPQGNILVLTTSKEAAEAAINRLFVAR